MFYSHPTAPDFLKRVSTIQHTAVTHQDTFSFMGEELLFQCNDPYVLEMAMEVYGRFPLATPSEQAPLQFQLFVQESVDDDGQMRPVVQAQGNLFYLRMGAGNYGLADLAQGFATAFITPQMLQSRELVQPAFLEAFPQAMLGLSRDFVAVHAACVVKNGVSVMLLGESGTGKSTLTYACARRGYQILAEDVVQTKVTADGLHLWGIPWRIGLLADAVQFFPELADLPQVQRMNGEWKIEVDLDVLWPNTAVSQAKPGIVVMLQRGELTGEPSSWHKLSLGEALAQFEVVWSWNTGWQDWYERPFKELLAHHVYQLIMTEPPDGVVSRLDDLLSSVDRAV